MTDSWRPDRAPACFSERQFELWTQARQSKDISPCNDCTPAFQLDMITQGRCENPRIQFVWRRKPEPEDAFEELMGVRRVYNDDVVAEFTDHAPYRRV